MPSEEISLPFSARNRGALAQIDNDCPETARIGLLHILHRMVEQDYTQGWRRVNAELQRIGRLVPDDTPYPHETQRILLELPWEKVFDFCERLYSHLVQDSYRENGLSGEVELVTSRSDAQKYLATELERVFLEENLAFEFSDGLVRRRGSRHTAAQVSRAELVLGAPRLSKSRGHFNKALKYFRDVSNPDFENAVKEAVCAVEATARVLFPSEGSTLPRVVKSITGNEAGQLPPQMAQTFEGLYGFRNGGEGVGHGGTSGATATKELAEYSLALAASQIVLLVQLEAVREPDIPF